MRVLANHCRRRGRVPALHAEAAQRLLVHEWPGNVRELENVMQRALVLCDGDVITAEHLSFEPVTEVVAVSNISAPLTKNFIAPLQQASSSETELAASLAVAEQQLSRGIAQRAGQSRATGGATGYQPAHAAL